MKSREHQAGRLQKVLCHGAACPPRMLCISAGDSQSFAKNTTKAKGEGQRCQVKGQRMSGQTKVTQCQIGQGRQWMDFKCNKEFKIIWYWVCIIPTSTKAVLTNQTCRIINKDVCGGGNMWVYVGGCFREIYLYHYSLHEDFIIIFLYFQKWTFHRNKMVFSQILSRKELINMYYILQERIKN